MEPVKQHLSRILYGLTEPSGGKIDVKLGENWMDMTERSIWKRESYTLSWEFYTRNTVFILTETVLGNLTEAISLELPAEFAKMKAIYVLKAVGFDEEYAN